MNLLFIGDIIGRPGRRVISTVLPELISAYDVEIIAANVENAAGGFGITSEVYDQLVALGIDVLTSGNHIWDKRDFIKEIDDCELLLRPANFAPGVPGKGYLALDTEHGPVAFINLCGRVFMESVDCPFRTADRILKELEADIKMIVVDFHAEATSEKIALGHYLDGRVSAVIGTHTHVTTADERILPQGTAYITDIGMTGPARSVIGVKAQSAIEKFLTGMPQRFEVASGPIELNAAAVSIDQKTGRATSIKRISRTID